jgi:hypothetical protein
MTLYSSSLGIATAATVVSSSSWSLWTRFGTMTSAGDCGSANHCRNCIVRLTAKCQSCRRHEPDDDVVYTSTMAYHHPTASSIILPPTDDWRSQKLWPQHCNQERPYNDDSTASRPLCEVKHRLARLVLRWGTTLESLVLFFWIFRVPASHFDCR